MIEKVRSSYFETNSSSMDRYDDSEFYNDYPHTVHVKQRVHIEFEWQDGVSNDRINEILDQMSDNTKIEEELYKIFESHYENSESLNIDSISDYDLVFEFDNCTVDLSWHGRHFAATRWDPEEFPEWDIEDYDGVPEKQKEYQSKERDKQAIMKIFQENGWTEIIGITDIYSDEIDEDDIERAIDY